MSILSAQMSEEHSIMQAKRRYSRELAAYTFEQYRVARRASDAAKEREKEKKRNAAAAAGMSSSSSPRTIVNGKSANADGHGGNVTAVRRGGVPPLRDDEDADDDADLGCSDSDTDSDYDSDETTQDRPEQQARERSTRRTLFITRNRAKDNHTGTQSRSQQRKF